MIQSAEVYDKTVPYTFGSNESMNNQAISPLLASVQKTTSTPHCLQPMRFVWESASIIP